MLDWMINKIAKIPPRKQNESTQRTPEIFRREAYYM